MTFTTSIMKYKYVHPPRTSFFSKYTEILTCLPSSDYGPTLGSPKSTPGAPEPENQVSLIKTQKENKSTKYEFVFDF